MLYVSRKFVDRCNKSTHMSASILLYSMSSLDDAAEQGPETMDPIPAENDANTAHIITVTVGATVPTGFEHTAAEEVKEKIGVDVHISKDRGRIYFPITTDKLFQV